MYKNVAFLYWTLPERQEAWNRVGFSGSTLKRQACVCPGTAHVTQHVFNFVISTVNVCEMLIFRLRPRHNNLHDQDTNGNELAL